MPETLVALARQRSGLLAVVSTADDDETGPRCAVVQKRIDEIRPEVRPRTVRVVEAWRRLERGSARDPRALAAAVAVLIETVPFRNERSLRAADDLVSAVCHVAAWHHLRPTVPSAWDELADALSRLGYDAAAVDRLRTARDPYLAVHHDALEAPGLAALPDAFRTEILPLLRSRPWRDVRHGLSLYWALGLGRDVTLRALVVRVLALSPVHGTGWWACLPSLPPDRRRTFVRLLLDADATATEAPSIAILGFVAEVPGERYKDRLRHLFAGLRDRVPIGHVLASFRIADRFGRDAGFVRSWSRLRHSVALPVGNRADAEATIDSVLAHVAPVLRGGAPRRFPIDLWERSARSPTVARLLERRCLRRWPPATTLLFLRNFAYDEEDATALPLDAKADLAERLLAGVPPARHGKAIDGLESCIARWSRRGDRLALLEAAVPLLARLAHGRSRKNSFCGLAVCALVEAAGPQRRGQLLALPERSLDRLDRALAFEHNLLEDGLAALAVRARGLLLDAFATHPEALFAAARALGSLSAPRRAGLLKRFRAHPVMRRRFLALPVAEVCLQIARLGSPGMPNPVPRRLRQHLEGAAVLSAESVERHRQAIARRLLPFRIGLLRRMVVDDLSRAVPGADPAGANERHALQMLSGVRVNRRILRRVLRVPAGDRRDFLRSHPANVAWLRRHPRLDSATWTTGPLRVAAVAGRGTLRLAFETDPLEVLTLGTKVGSCLSAGGTFADAAVAVMVDVNKQAVFARDASGLFVARQVVAVTADDRILFSPVYPLGLESAVKDAFHEYDLALSAALGLPPYRAADAADYRVEDILARDSYDDGVWDRFAGPDKGGEN